MAINKKLPFLLICFLFLPVFASTSFAAEEDPCLTCHQKLKPTEKHVHAALALGCQTCHKQVEGKKHPGEKNAIILTQDMPGLCYSCHEKSKFKGKSNHKPVDSGTCMGCHNAHQSPYPKILKKDIPGICYTCHDEKKFKGKSGHTLVGMCTGCHAPHSSNTEKLLISGQPDLCYNCHNKAEFAKKYVHGIISVGGCTACHSAHISNFPKLLPSDVQTLCISCHRAKTDGRHIVSLPGRQVHPVKGTNPATRKLIKVPDPKKPGKEIFILDPKQPPPEEFTCATCHLPHCSDNAKLFPQKNICSKCHKYL
jgi:predicted CXXCH cytochrome family protein